MLKGIHISLLIGPVVAVPAPKPVVEALTAVQVTVASGQRSGFQLTFGLSKHSLLNTVLIPTGYFDPLVRVIVVVTVNGIPNVIMDGLITKQQVTPSNEIGQSTLTVTGEDVSVAMDKIDFSGFPYPAVPAEGRVAIMVAKYAMFGLVPMVIPSVLINIPNPLENIPGQKGTDLQYINQLAGEVGYVFYVEPGPAPGTNIAYWGPEVKTGVPQPALSVNMDAHSNVESLSFSLDGMSKKLYILYIQNLLTKAPIPIPIPDITPLNPPLGARPPVPQVVEFLTNEPDQKGTTKYSPVQAAAIGLAKAAKSADAVTGNGTLDVLRYGRVLKARQLVGVRGAGLAYDGLYYVRSVTHNIKRGEYKQSFTLSRNALIPTTPLVPV
jgi:hypothetical protein